LSWNKIDQVAPPIGRPVLIRTAEDADTIVAFLSRDGVWYSGGALVQNSMNVLGVIPIEWCEPQGEQRL
jgi:hypothetical protein